MHVRKTLAVIKWSLASVVFGLFVFLVLNTLTFSSKQISVKAIKSIELDDAALIEHIVEAIRFETVSYDDLSQSDRREFQEFVQFLERTYPNVHSHLRREIVNEHSLLYTWEGRDPRLKPILLMAHYDVVPVTDETLRDWTHPPFAGVVSDGHIWGRGAMDNKINVISILDAAEHLLKEGFSPSRSVYIAFGHDEENGGRQGAAEIAKIFKQRGLKFKYILDEGGAVALKFFPSVPHPVALVGIAEKGYLSIEYTVTGDGGHSSMPDDEQPVFVLLQALTRTLEARQQDPPKMERPIRQMMEYLGPEMTDFKKKVVAANLWLFESIVVRQMAKNRFSRNMVKSTAAVTGLSIGTKENVLSDTARAIVNFRLLPGQSIEEVIQREKAVVDDDRVKLRGLPNFKRPSSVSDVASPAYQNLAKTIREMDPSIVVVPWLFIASTDSRHYADFSDNIYRFTFLRATVDYLKTIHGTDERILTQSYLESVRFYRQLILNSQ